MNNIENQSKWHSDSKNWKNIFFYYNPEDSRLIVDKRSKLDGNNF